MDPLQHRATSSDADREYAFSLTGQFEGSSFSALQTKDAGIVSYGRHQATLASGSLEEVLRRYTSNSQNELALGLKSYLPRVDAQDQTLRDDQPFLKLLRLAGTDPEMQQAQTETFADLYWKPALQTAEKLGIESSLGKAILFDTQVQGGINSISKQLVGEPEFKTTDEKARLTRFLELRKSYLERIADRKESADDFVTAKYLRNSVSNRLGKLKRLLP